MDNQNSPISFPQPVSGEPVFIVGYDSSWPRKYEEERHAIVDALGKTVIDIQHVGSTSVPGLAAKPVIDIMVGVATLGCSSQEIAALWGLGYEFRGEANPGSLYFRKGAPRSHQLHVAVVDSSFWCNLLLFRDYLRGHPSRAKQYEILKRALVAMFQHDRIAYSQAKTDFVQETLLMARQWQEARAT